MRNHFFAGVTGIAAAALLAGVVGNLAADPTINVIPGEQMRIRASTSTITPVTKAIGLEATDWNAILVVEDDNENPSLGSSFRRWWHVEIAGFEGSGDETLNVTVQNAGYSDAITPVWSLDGGLTYDRIPLSAGMTGFQFSLAIPAGVTAIRLAKYYPATLTEFATYREKVLQSPRVTETVLGQTALDLPIYMWEITDSSVSSAGKKRVWIHAAVHPSENTAYFVTQGLVDWLLSNDGGARNLLDNVIFDIVPHANPDGIYRGNYRTNANSVNLEVQWASPYTSTSSEEVVAMRSKIEEFMGTVGNPGSNPIELLLNLHASHGLGYPFHFVHAPTYNSNGTGVIPEVNALEVKWVNAFKARSPFANLGSNQSSTLSGRPYVESMMHDRYSLHPDTWSPVMAITFEGTYELSPEPGRPNTPEDYRQCGREMGQAIGDYFGFAVDGLGTQWALY